jgi:hypothetical protein
LDKALYEFKQNARVWYKRFRQRLEELDYIIFSNNNLILYHQLKKLIITLYIDDIHCIGKSLNEIKELEELLIKIFKISNFGDSKIYLKININYSQLQRIYDFNQFNYIKKIIDKYNYNDLKVRKIPIKINFRFIKFKK